MFGSSKSTEEKKISPSSNTSSSNALNSLVKGSTMEGTLRCESDLRVDGTIKGKLDCVAKLIIGASGVVDGEVRCQNAVIEGTFRGTLRVSEVLNVRENAKIDGDIFTGKLIVQSGAKFNVACKMGDDASSSAQNVKNNASLATTKA